MTGATHGILVGYDGSPGSERALCWAVRETYWHGSVLTLCHAHAPGGVTAPQGEVEAPGDKQDIGEQFAAALRFAMNILGAGQVRPLLAAGPAARVLCEYSVDADLVVVGARGRDTLPGSALGPVSQQVCAHASGHVVVVRGHWQPAAAYAPGMVVVGADGSAASAAAIAFAAEEAALREVPLLAVCALADSPGGLGAARPIQEAFDGDLARWEKKHPELTILRRVTPGQPRTALLEAACDAQLLVVGSRGQGGLAGMALGSVSQAMLHCAPCPVGVVHP